MAVEQETKMKITKPRVKVSNEQKISYLKEDETSTRNWIVKSPRSRPVRVFTNESKAQNR